MAVLRHPQVRVSDLYQAWRYWSVEAVLLGAQLNVAWRSWGWMSTGQLILEEELLQVQPVALSVTTVMYQAVVERMGSLDVKEQVGVGGKWLVCQVMALG